MAVKWLGAFPGIAPRLAVHTATAGHPVDSHYGSILSHLLYSMARQWLHQPKGSLHRPNQTKVQDALKGRRVSLRSGASWAGSGRDGGDPSAAARRPRRPACTLSAKAFRRPHLRFEPPACDTPPPPHPIPTDMANRERPVCLFPKYELIWNRT